MIMKTTDKKIMIIQLPQRQISDANVKLRQVDNRSSDRRMNRHDGGGRKGNAENVG